jgi:hypothetical protein
MKYLEKYIEEKMRIKILGELTTRECSEGDDVGVSLVIDGYEPGIEIWYVDYANWLEEKIENSHYKNMFSGCEKPNVNYKNIFGGCEKPNVNKMTLEEFRDDVLTAMKNKPESWRDGQFVFNYIDNMYGGIRQALQISNVDCYNNDKHIDEFINACFSYLTTKIK